MAQVVSCSRRIENRVSSLRLDHCEASIRSGIPRMLDRSAPVGEGVCMHRLVAAVTVLIHFCVQSIPHVSAEEATLPIENVIIESEGYGEAGRTESGSMIPTASSSGTSLHIISPTGATVIEPVVESGAVLASAGSGSTMTGAALAGTGNVLAADVPYEAPVPAPASPVRVIVTEAMWMGSDRSTADEWVEVAAFSSGSAMLPRSLSGWTLVSVRAGVETTLARLRPEHVAASGSVFVLANAPAASSRLSHEPSLVTTAMSLPNTQLLLRLKDASGAVMDEVDDGIGTPFAGANPSGGAKASMERIAPWAPGNAQASWKTATLSIGFDEGVPIYGTPGALGPVRIDAPPPADVPVTPPPPVVVPPALRLTELMANPPGADTDEWIEIGSFDPLQVELSNLALRIGTVRFGLSGTLAPGEHRRFGKLLTGLPLPNSSGTVELLWRDRPIDAWTYGESAEGVSLGRAVDGTVAHLCVPSPDAPNTGASLDPHIAVQSSSASAGKLSLNLEARVAAGSLAGATCSWVYPDGYANASCNPPSHSMPGPLLGDVLLTVRDYCGNTLVRTLHVDIAGKLDDDREREGPVCVPAAFTGVVVSEFVPNPVGDEALGEWIELSNPSEVEKPLCGWSLDDGERGSDPYPLDRWRLPPGASLVLPREETGISLNNDADAVRLFAPLRGGGSGAYEIVRFTGSPEGASHARRADGAWLWTHDPTPGAGNRFPDVRWPEQVLARIAAAMPNPDGPDADGEWVELENLTPYPLPVTGWSLETASDRVPLESAVLGPKERLRIPAPTLANGEGFARLVDRDGLTHSVLAWNNAKDGVAERYPQPVAHVSGFSFVSSDDCRRWIVKNPDGSTGSVMLAGISIDEYKKCIDYVSVVIEDKKIDLEMYSYYGESSAFLHGTDIASLLVRNGFAFPDEERPSPFAERYRLDESEARSQRRGAWSDDIRAALIDEGRTAAAFRRVLASEGLLIRTSVASGVIDPGAVVEIETNVPASVWVATGSGEYQPYASPIAIEGDVVLRIRAASDVQTASGFSLTIESFQPYEIRKSLYPSLYVSEAYPSPNAGESEWVELWNPHREPVSLLGWSIDDVETGGSKPTTFEPGVVLAPGERRIFGALPISWNNTGDEIRLIDPNGWEVHRLTYESVKKGRAVAVTFDRHGDPLGQCPTARATPGAENRCAEEPLTAKKSKTPKRSVVRTATMGVRYRNLLAENVADAPRGRFAELLGAMAGRYTAEMPVRRIALGALVLAVIGLLLLRMLRKGH